MSRGPRRQFAANEVYGALFEQVKLIWSEPPESVDGIRSSEVGSDHRMDRLGTSTIQRRFDQPRVGATACLSSLGAWLGAGGDADGWPLV